MTETPRTWTLVFCQDCGEMLGVQDHVRVRDEHFGYAGHRGMRFVEVVEKAPVDAERERLLNLIEDLLITIKTSTVHGSLEFYDRAKGLLREYGRLGKEES